MAKCVKCGDDYSDKRKDLDYNTCLSCGAEEAREQAIAKSKRISIIFNKGGNQYITDREDIKDLGK